MGSKKEITAAEVELYLLDNLDFFKSRESLVSELEFKDSVSGASSLLERQVQKLRTEQNSLSSLLNKFLSNASENEALFNNTKDLLLRALASNDSKEMFVESESYFLNIEGIDFCSCKFFDAEDKSIIENALGDALQKERIYIGSFSFEKAEQIFGHKKLRSGVIAISKAPKKSVLIKLASKDGSRYIGDEGTTLIEYVLEILAAIANKLDG